MNRRLIFFVTLGVLALTIIAYLLTHFSFVSFDAKEGTTLSLHTKQKNGASDKPTAILNQSQKIAFIAHGSYRAVFSRPDFEDKPEDVSIESLSHSFSTPDLNYTEAKLENILTQEKDSIHKIVPLATDKIQYTISREKLYLKGEWYGATLRPSDPSTADILKVICHKIDGSWKMVVSPRITIFKGEFPDVPPPVISSTVNNR
ncbi:MAG TPA: hypothetical protein VFB59_05600 [Candidatus Saccharimonadales bacterium]|nr:hypothetical protein [Candidatus Saccharimonadales bacterium]